MPEPEEDEQVKVARETATAYWKLRDVLQTGGDPADTHLELRRCYRGERRDVIDRPIPNDQRGRDLWLFYVDQTIRDEIDCGTLMDVFSSLHPAACSTE